VIRSKATEAVLRYTISESWLPKLIDLNKTLDPMGHDEEVMKEHDLFSVELAPAAKASA
jgi:hypothetical protein